MDADASHSGKKEAYNRRTTDYGNGRIEIAAYGVPRTRQQGSRITSSGKKAETTDEEQEERTKQQVYAIRRKIKGYALSNAFEWFITLTFDPKKVNSSDYETAKDTLSKWCREMRDKNRKKNKQFDYLIIPELHQSGRVHFHGLLSDISANFVEAQNLKTGKTIIRHGRRVYNLTDWKYGFSDCEKIESPERAASYITKYVTSALLTDKKMYNKKRYFNSQGLAKPVITYDMSDNTELDRFTPNFGIIETDIDGRNIIDIGIYNLKKDKETGALSQTDDNYFIAAKTAFLPPAEYREELSRLEEIKRQQKLAKWEKFLQEKRKSEIAAQTENETALSTEEDWEKMFQQAEENRQQHEEKMREYWEAEAKRKQQQKEEQVKKDLEAEAKRTQQQSEAEVKRTPREKEIFEKIDEEYAKLSPQEKEDLKKRNEEWKKYNAEWLREQMELKRKKKEGKKIKPIGEKYAAEVFSKMHTEWQQLIREGEENG